MAHANCKSKKKKNSSTFSVNLPSKTRLVEGILFNLCQLQILQQKRKRGFGKFNSFLLPWLC